jgi:hypothetical protein
MLLLVALPQVLALALVPATHTASRVRGCVQLARVPSPCCMSADEGCTTRPPYPLVRGDLRTRPSSSKIAFAALSVGGATLGTVIAGPMGLLHGSAVGWMCASFLDTVLQAWQRRESSDEAPTSVDDLSLLRELEVSEMSDPRLRGEMDRRLNRLLNDR